MVEGYLRAAARQPKPLKPWALIQAARKTSAARGARLLSVTACAAQTCMNFAYPAPWRLPTHETPNNPKHPKLNPPRNLELTIGAPLVGLVFRLRVFGVVQPTNKEQKGPWGPTKPQGLQTQSCG